MQKVWQFMQEGAPFSFVNALILAVVIAIIVDRFVHILSKHQVNGENLHASPEQRHPNELRDRCKNNCN